MSAPGIFLKGKEKQQCKHWWERKTRGRRYVNARGQCQRETWHPSGYCKEHRYAWRWTEAQELAARMVAPPSSPEDALPPGSEPKDETGCDV